MSLYSIIVPVFKAEAYIDKCVQSVIHQTFTDWELILVDDGSPDSSGHICDRYSHKDKRIKSYHKTNGGVSSARNLGLEHATGDWIMFLDSDDWLKPETLYRCSLFKEDIIRFGIEEYYANGTIERYLDRESSVDKYIRQLISRQTFLCVCGGAYKKKLLADLSFDTTLIYGEDWIFSFELAKRSTSVRMINEPLYCYNKENDSSCTNNYSMSKAESGFYALKYISEKVDNFIYGKELAIAKGKLISENTIGILSYKEIILLSNIVPLNRELYPSAYMSSSVRFISKLSFILNYSRIGHLILSCYRKMKQ